MEVRIVLYDETNRGYSGEVLSTSAYSYPVRDISFCGTNQDFYEKVVEYAELLHNKKQNNEN